MLTSDGMRDDVLLLPKLGQLLRLRADLKDQTTLRGCTTGSYKRNEKKENFTTYKNLLQNYLWDRDFTLSWLKDEGLIAPVRICTICGPEMNWIEYGDRSDSYVVVKGRDVRGALGRSREGCWFEKAKLEN